MSGKTKIYVFRMKELIYTLVFAALAIVLILLFVFMFGTGREKDVQPTASYKAGIYTSTINIQGQAIDVQVAVDSDHINSVSFVNLDESVATMYPLMETSMKNISEQICENQSLDGITYAEESQYTSRMLLGAVDEALQKAMVQKEEDGTQEVLSEKIVD